MFDYNNAQHNATLHKPIEVFYSTSDDLMQLVYVNTLNSFRHLNTDHTIFDLNEKVLLYSNFIIDNINKKFFIISKKK